MNVTVERMVGLLFRLTRDKCMIAKSQWRTTNPLRILQSVNTSDRSKTGLTMSPSLCPAGERETFHDGNGQARNTGCTSTPFTQSVIATSSRTRALLRSLPRRSPKCLETLQRRCKQTGTVKARRLPILLSLVTL